MSSFVGSLVFGIFGMVLFLYFFVPDFIRATKEKRLAKSSVGKAALMLLLIIPLAIALVNLLPNYPLVKGWNPVFYFSVLLSGLVSWIWARYIRSIDIFEPERLRFLVMVFVLACMTVFLVFPISAWIRSMGFVLNGNGLNDFLYSTIVIGSVEEFVKILPVLILLVFSSQIDEPLDFIVYGSMSALGFAFIENILYLNSTGLSALSARLLYSSVAHMFDTSVICYAMAISKLKTGKIRWRYFLAGFMLASLAHGFYDFWLINEAFYFPIVTTFFFLGSLHIWVTMKNNLMNLSNFYDSQVRLNKNKLQYDLVFLILMAIILGYVFYALMNGSSRANRLLLDSFIYYLYIIVYITTTFSSFNIVRGYKAPIEFPRFFFRPKLEAFPNYQGTRLSLLKPRRLGGGISMKGLLMERKVVEQDYNWYLFRNEEDQKIYLIRPFSFERDFTPDVPKKVKLCKLKDKVSHEKAVFDASDILNCTPLFGLMSE